MSNPLEPERPPRPRRKVDINQTVFTATLTARPELATLRDGTTPYTRLRCVIVGRPNPETRESKLIRVAVLYFGARAEDLCREDVRDGSWIALQGRLDYAEWERDEITRRELRVVADQIVVIGDPDRGPIMLTGEHATPDGISQQPAMPLPWTGAPAQAHDPRDDLTERVLARFAIEP